MELNEFIQWIKKEGRLADLKNFTGAVCKQQIENVLKSVRNANDHLTYLNGINNARQPQIEDLLTKK